MTDDERVAADEHGAEVVEIQPGLYEVFCVSHATQLISDQRAYLDRRAEGHNANWHPGLKDKTAQGLTKECE